MSQSQGNRTAQEDFWAGSFGNDYIARNRSAQLLSSNIRFFAQALRVAGSLGSCVELGANIGMNLAALRALYPAIEMQAVEINTEAARELAAEIGEKRVFNGSILDWAPSKASDLALIKTVLIHINPERLNEVYDKLYAASRRFILVAEYYNPAPVAISYRGHDERLFKRDFAGELLDRFPDLRLRDYGFAYHRDPAFPQDDINWFLLEKKGD